MLFFFGGGSSLTGVDIGSSAIKVIRGKKQKNSFIVKDLAIVPLPYKAVDDQGIVDAETVLSAIVSAFQQIGLKNPSVASAIKGSGVLTKRIVIAHFPKKEIPDQVRWEAEQVFPTDTSTIFIDHILLGEVSSIPGAPPGTPGWEILLIGVRQDAVRAIHQLLSNAGANPEVIDLDSFVIADFLDDVLGLSPSEVIAFVDVGASGTRISVRHKKHVIFVRQFQIGGNNFTEAISQALGLSFEDAESLKIQDGSGIPQEAQDALQMTLQSWKSELQQCEDIFVTQESNAVISRWVLFGGGTLTPGLVSCLQDEHFGSKTALVPSENILRAGNKNIDESVLASWATRLMTAAGLASRKGK